MKKSTIYILTSENFQKEVLNSKQPVLVEFSTEWCGTSHIIAPIIKEMTVKFKDDIKFCKIDIDEYEELSKQYGVRKIPTILLFNNGKVVDFIVGVVSRKVLVKNLTLLSIKRKD
ncbi:MAG: thioredoxin [Desulfobacteraceae bacterium]|nr:thioredoxin [Desulfobacteraceae bacterium]MBC2757383.1 thioredoxin [Desulfobacteraceae bacterium]